MDNVKYLFIYDYLKTAVLQSVLICSGIYFLQTQSKLQFFQEQTPSHHLPKFNKFLPKNTHSWCSRPKLFLSGSPKNIWAWDKKTIMELRLTLVPIIKVPLSSVHPCKLSVGFLNLSSYPCVLETFLSHVASNEETLSFIFTLAQFLFKTTLEIYFSL